MEQREQQVWADLDVACAQWLGSPYQGTRSGRARRRMLNTRDRSRS